jgi:LPS O-antigen subunit length determinant protein (WzzB/FepE family)
MDLLQIDGASPSLRMESAVRTLRQIVTASEDIKLGAVKLTVTTKWPSVSLRVADRLVNGVNQFNVETRKSQAAAERQFVEAQAGEAESALRAAEDRMQFFLQRNRASAAPELAFEQDRLQRDLNLRQQVYTQLVQNREEAKIREVRDIPVITILESPRLPAVAKPRNMVLRILIGGLGGGMLGVLFALAANGMAGARRASTDDARDFFQLLEEAKPRFPKRPARSSP